MQRICPHRCIVLNHSVHGCMNVVFLNMYLSMQKPIKSKIWKKNKKKNLWCDQWPRKQPSVRNMNSKESEDAPQCQLLCRALESLYDPQSIVRQTSANEFIESKYQRFLNMTQPVGAHLCRVSNPFMRTTVKLQWNRKESCTVINTNNKLAARYW